MFIIRDAARLTVNDVNEIIRHCASNVSSLYVHGREYRAKHLLMGPAHTAADLGKLLDENLGYAAVVNRGNYNVWAVFEAEKLNRYLVAYLWGDELKHKWVAARNPDEAVRGFTSGLLPFRVLKVYTEAMAEEFVQKIKGGSRES